MVLALALVWLLQTTGNPPQSSICWNIFSVLPHFSNTLPHSLHLPLSSLSLSRIHSSSPSFLCFVCGFCGCFCHSATTTHVESTRKTTRTRTRMNYVIARRDAAHTMQYVFVFTFVRNITTVWTCQPDRFHEENGPLSFGYRERDVEKMWHNERQRRRRRERSISRWDKNKKICRQRSLNEPLQARQIWNNLSLSVNVRTLCSRTFNFPPNDDDNAKKYTSERFQRSALCVQRRLWIICISFGTKRMARTLLLFLFWISELWRLVFFYFVICFACGELNTVHAQRTHTPNSTGKYNK